MSTFRATATREGRWWVIDVDGVGVTQARNLTEARVMALDLAAIMTGEPEASIDIDLHVDLADDLAQEIADAKAAVEDLADRQVKVARISRKAARDLVAAHGVSGRDAAVILGISPQRVSQLLADG
jgi:hypothetical protein